MPMLLGEPHHDGSAQYVDSGRPAPGDVVGLRVWVPHTVSGHPGAADVALRVVRDGEPHLSTAQVERTDDCGTWWRAELTAVNPVNSYRFLIVPPGNEGPRWLNGTGVHAREVTDAADFRISTHSPAPDWLPEQVVYEVFPDRFAASAPDASGDRPNQPDWAVPAPWDQPVEHVGPLTSRQFYGGDLHGVRRHLDHLRRLGATLLYLTPVFEARSNHRYDAVSFERIDPLLGGTAALERLIAAAHEQGIRVMGDLTTNHTGSGHEWFRAALADRQSPEASFYRFDGEEYESWLGVESLPKLDHSSPSLRRRLYGGEGSVVARWLGAGLDGWRIDVANMTGRLGRQDLNGAVAQEIRATMSATRPDSWLLAEHGFDASLDLAGNGWDGVMDYAGFTQPLWAWLNGGSPEGPGELHGLQYSSLPIPLPVRPTGAIVATMREVHAAMPWRSWVASTSMLDTHDTPRFRTVAGGGTSGWIDGKGRGRDRHLTGLALQMTMPGVPGIFMGDEIGLTATDGEHARTPFPWHAQEWDAETFSAYQSWIALRHNHIALRRGGLRWAHLGPDSMTFLREHPEQRLLVHVARAAHAPVDLPLRLLGLRRPKQVVTLTGGAAEPVDSAGHGLPGVRLPADGPAAHVYDLRPR